MTPESTKKSPQDEFPAGAIELQVRAEMAALLNAHPFAESLAEVAFALARRLDRVPDEKVARELRLTLGELAGMGAGGDDDLDKLISNPTGRNDMPPEVRD